MQTFYVNYRRRYNLDQLVKEYEAKIAAEKANAAPDDVKDDKKEEKVTAATGQSNANEPVSTKEVSTPESPQTPTDLGKPGKPDTNPLKRDAGSEVSYFI